MNDKKQYIEIALRAARRAADRVSEKARRENRPLPVWKKDHIEFEVPNYSQQNNPADH